MATFSHKCSLASETHTDVVTYRSHVRRCFQNTGGDPWRHDPAGDLVHRPRVTHVGRSNVAVTYSVDPSVRDARDLSLP